MIFKKIFFLWFGLMVAGLVSAETEAERFVRSVFEEIPDERVLTIEPDVGKKITSLLGSYYSGKSVSYWQKNQQTVWILEARGMSNPIQTGFLIEQGRIIKSEVLAYRETRGRQVRSERFLKQFKGLFLKENGALSRDIDGYSGATISVNAVCGMARVALYLDSLVTGAGTQD